MEKERVRGDKMLANRSARVRAMDESYVKQREQELERQEKRKRGLRRRLSVLAVIAFTLGCISFVTIYAQAATVEEKNLQKAELEVQLEELQAEEKRLYQDIKNYNDLDYIAEIARRDYFLSKPGETLFKLPEPSSN